MVSPIRTSLTWALLVGSSPVSAALQCDLDAVRLEAALEARDWGGYLQGATALRERCPDLQPDVTYHEGQALLALGDADGAHERLMAYVEQVGRDGRYYDEALSVIVDLESGSASAAEGAVAEMPRVLIDGDPVGQVTAENPEYFYLKYRVPGGTQVSMGALYVKPDPDSDLRVFLHDGKTLDDGEYSALPFRVVDRFGRTWAPDAVRVARAEVSRLVAEVEAEAERIGPMLAQTPQQQQSEKPSFFKSMLGAAVNDKISREIGGSSSSALFADPGSGMGALLADDASAEALLARELGAEGLSAEGLSAEALLARELGVEGLSADGLSAEALLARELSGGASLGGRGSSGIGPSDRALTQQLLARQGASTDDAGARLVDAMFISGPDLKFKGSPVAFPVKGPFWSDQNFVSLAVEGSRRASILEQRARLDEMAAIFAMIEPGSPVYRAADVTSREATSDEVLDDAL